MIKYGLNYEQGNQIGAIEEVRGEPLVINKIYEFFFFRI